MNAPTPEPTHGQTVDYTTGKLSSPYRQPSTPTALVVAVDGTVTPHQLPEGDHIAFLQDKVEGYFEVVSLSPDVDMWVNEEGLFTHEVNPVATTIAAAFGMDHQRYHGPAVFTGGIDDDGNTLPLPPEWAIEIRAAVKLLGALND